MRLIHWLIARINTAFDPWPYCWACGHLYDPDGEGHAAACRRWRS